MLLILLLFAGELWNGDTPSIFSSISTDTINSNNDAQITFTDDAVFDSTLFEGIRYYTIRQEPGSGNQYESITATAGSGNAYSLHIGQLNINYHNLDSIKIDSIRWGAQFSVDSIAIYQMNFEISEETSTSITSKKYINSGDSLFVPAGSPGWQYASKIFTEQHGTSVDVFDYPLFMGAYRWYWHNRTSATGTVRIWPPEIFLKAFYSK